MLLPNVNVYPVDMQVLYDDCAGVNGVDLVTITMQVWRQCRTHTSVCNPEAGGRGGAACVSISMYIRDLLWPFWHAC